MSPTMNSRRSLGPITRLSSGSGPFTSWVSAVVALMALLPFREEVRWRHSGLDRRPVPPPRRSAEEDLRLGVLLGADELELAGALDERHPDDVRATQRHHGAELTVGDRVDRVKPESGGEPPVEGGGGAATLDVAEDHGARL